jgi:hypothetical protein
VSTVKPNQSLLQFFLFSAVQWYATIDAKFDRTIDQSVQENVGRFRTEIQRLCDPSDIDLNSLQQELDRQVDHFTNLASGWNLVMINQLTLHIARYRPLIGSSFIATPRSLIYKHCIVNVECEGQNCFQYAILSAMFPAHKNSERMSKYTPHIDKVNWSGLTYPVKLPTIRQFERNNLNLTVNVYKYIEPTNTENEEVVPIYITKHSHRDIHINLLLISNDATSHYVWIKNMSSLLAGRTKGHHITFVCPHCIHPFTNEHAFDNHFDDCSKHIHQKILYPSDEEKFLFWKSRSKTELYKFCIYADFESYLDEKVEGNVLNEHEPSGFCIYTVSSDEEFQLPPILYSGEDVMERFFDALLAEQRRISCILGVNYKMLPLTRAEETMFNNTTLCPKCNSGFSDQNRKTRHHNHATGNFITALCNACNMQIKPRKRKYWRPKMNRKEYRNDPEHDRLPQDCDKFNFQIHIPVCYHGLSNYDAHHIFKYFNKRVVKMFDNKPKNDDDEDKKGDASLNVPIIALNLERFVSFELLNLRFIDTVKFLNSSLEVLVENLVKSCILPFDKFIHTRQHLGESSLLFAKGVFPYQYFNSLERFKETKLPPKEKFYNSLKEEEISDEDYERAQKIWKNFNCKTFEDFHNHYLMTDVLLLSDVYECFRRTGMNFYGLDPCQYLTLPAFSWDALLKYTDIKLELISDPEIFLFFENNIRGGVSVCSHRYARANNQYLPDFNPDKATSYLAYLDANNLYGWAMSQYLPIGKFRFLTECEIAKIDFLDLVDNAETGYVLEVDLEYPESLHDSHNDYPLAPENVLITRDMLSPFCLSFNQKHIDSNKLVPNLRNKMKYVIHYRNLKLYVELGMKIKRIYRVLSFVQSPWMKEYIDFNTEKRKCAQNNFEKDFFKLMNNSVFGKTMENVRRHTKINLVSDPIKFMKMTSRPQIKHFKIINEDAVIVERIKSAVLLCKPIYTGFCVLDLSKLLMYNFHYNVIVAKYRENVKVLYTDTDSLLYAISTPNLYTDIREMANEFDLSDYPENSGLKSMTNAKVLGKMKDECSGKAAVEFVGLRSKMYSLLVEQNKPAKLTAKGVKHGYVRKHVRHEMYLHTLKSRIGTTATFLNFRSRNHVIETVQFVKKCLAAYDDKRFVQEDGISTYAYGHYRICK